MDRTLLNKILLARRLNELARENLSSVNDLSLSIGVNLLQDAVEVFLLAVSEHVNAGIQSYTQFDKYFDAINAKIAPKELPFRPRLIALNRLRVNSKHHGLAPAQSETEGLLATVREFFDEVTRAILGLSFATLTLVDLVHAGEVKDMLTAAEQAFRNGDFETCLVSCRKAIFIRIEKAYDVAVFGNEDTASPLGLLGLGNRSPFYAKNKEYIEQNVKDATDYVVVDHDDLEMELVKSGIDSVSFWNVWRLTPEVYRPSVGVEWTIKKDWRKLDGEGIRERAEYVLDTTVNLFVAADQRQAGVRVPEYRNYVVRLHEEGVPVYSKADASSEVVATTPQGVREVFVDFEVPALNGEGTFWHVAHHTDEWSLWGYIRNEALE